MTFVEELHNLQLIGRMGGDSLGHLVRARHGPTDSTVAVRLSSARDLEPDGREHLRTLVERMDPLVDEWPIARVLEAGVVDDVCFVAMEFLPRGALGDVEIRKSVDAAALSALMLPFARAMAKADQVGLRHGRIDLRAVRLDRNDQLVLVDLGVRQAFKPVGPDLDVQALVALGRQLDLSGVMGSVWDNQPASLDSLIADLSAIAEQSPLDLPDAPTGLTITVGADTYRFNSGPVMIGRSAGAEIPLSNSGISRQHLRVDLDEKGWLLVDLESKQGSRSSGRTVTSLRLYDNTRVEIGRTNDPVVIHFEVGP